MRNFSKLLSKISFSSLIWMGLLLSLALTLRSLFSPAFFRTHDFTHAARLAEMQRSLADGEFPVRWSRNFGFGFGMPLFNFYAPLPYYVGQLPLALGLSPIDTTKFLYIFDGVLAFVGMYLLARELWGREGGLFAAVAFSFSTYRAVDLFVRGALGEAYGFALIPFALYGILLFAKKPKVGFVVTAVSLALILLSHNLTGMVSMAVLVCFWVAVQMAGHDKFKNFKLQLTLFVLAVLTGISLSAFYVLPAFLEKGYTRVDQTIVVGDFDYHNHFLCATQLLIGKWGYGGSNPDCQADLSFALGTGALALLAVASLYVFIGGKPKEKWMQGVILTGLLVSSFMTIGRSTWIWDRLSPLLKYMQFPWRFLTFAHVFLAAGIGASGGWIKKQKAIALLPLLILLLVLVIPQLQHFLPEKMLSGDQLTPYYDTSPAWIQSNISKTLPDYLPPEVKDSAFPKPVSVRLTSETGVIDVQKDAPASILATISCQFDCRVMVNIFQFPGWQAKLDGTRINLEKTGQGLPIYSVSVPAGVHRLSVDLKDTPIRALGNGLSLLSLMAIIVVMLLSCRKKPARTV